MSALRSKAGLRSSGVVWAFLAGSLFCFCGGIYAAYVGAAWSSLFFGISSVSWISVAFSHWLTEIARLRVAPGENAIQRASREWYSRISNQPTVHGTIMELAAALTAAERDATERERERCARIAHGYAYTGPAGGHHDDDWNKCAKELEAQIRASPAPDTEPSRAAAIEAKLCEVERVLYEDTNAADDPCCGWGPLWHEIRAVLGLPPETKL